MGTGTSEVPTSKNGQTDKDYDDAVRALAEAYARIEYVEENTNLCGDDLEAAKTAIGRTHATLFDAEVDRAHRELTDGVGADE